ncbi:MAG TPA: sporulation transcription factor Spo0A [Firmicutes bacterium]|nr:sporulation transcription factor Spo0A [Bacillota bacterium]HAW70561.1 sporulation transcription factor Spo0A [Bacillota bacterium]HAZ22968.1 sporulation transcription factor Spo0A [Bacillota bacterium]HBE06363.1 sporulation transcription factor Spo0A [Bacillota bacterium]HBG45068.1 sporulation transcription factor Spo0A [Bacillota bacterium]
MEQRKIRVLIADDNVDFCIMLRDYLAGHPRLAVVGIVHNGREVLQKLQTADIDVVLLDMIMPEFDGLAVLEEVRRSGNRKSTKFIVLSAFGQETMTQKAVQLGVDYFIVKPFNLNVLVRRIIEIVDHQSTQVVKNDPNVTEKEKQISRIFVELGIPVHFRGYLYLREAVMMAVENPEAVNGITKKMYPDIALRYNTTTHRVERSMRFAIEKAWSNGQLDALNKYFGFAVDERKGKPTNACFIAKIADQIRLGWEA